MLTLLQTRKLDRRVMVLLYGSSFWNELLDFNVLVRHGTIRQEDLELFRFVDTPEEALSILQQGLTLEMERETPAIARSVRPGARSGAAGPDHA